jgi:hypothetical protein
MSRPMLIVNILSVVMLNTAFNIVMQSVIMANVIMPIVVAPFSNKTWMEIN